MQSRLRLTLIVALVFVIAVVGLLVLAPSQSLYTVTTDGLPVPFVSTAYRGDSLVARLTDRGLKGAIPVIEGDFLGTEQTIELDIDKIYIVKVKDDPMVRTIPLAYAFRLRGTPDNRSVRVFGYSYTANALSETTAAQTPGGLTFPQLFPGQFWTTAQERTAGAAAMAAFEQSRGITFGPVENIAGTRYMERGRWYVVIANENTGISMDINPPTQCTNALVESPEPCDDGNAAAGDGCTSSCTVESGFTCAGNPSVCTLSQVCGNGVTQAPEQCDDGNTISGDGCSATCVPEICGDGIVQSGLLEECDDPGNSLCVNCRLVVPFGGGSSASASSSLAASSVASSSSSASVPSSSSSSSSSSVPN